MQRTAQVWIIYTLTNSPMMVGLISVGQFIPMLLFVLFAGVIVERMKKRNILLMTQSLFLVQALVLTGLTYLHYIKAEHILFFSLWFGLLQIFDMPAR